MANNLDGRRTAYGEIYNKNKLTAAHRTYPLGTLVNVTRLDNGKSITVRINDKGPFDESRVIDVSYAAAEVLDLVYDGIAMVKTQVVDEKGNPIQAPPSTSPAAKPAPTAYDQIQVPISYDYKPQFKQPENITAKSVPETTIPAAGGLPGSTPPVSPYQVDLQPKSPIPANQPNAFDAVASGRIDATAPAMGFFVQLGAFSNRDNAENLLSTLSSKGFNNAQIQGSGQLFKALVGPYNNISAAKEGKNKIAQALQLEGFVTEIK
jgi:rare lipoprotein A